MRRATSAFCVGEQRHATTADSFVVISMNSFLYKFRQSYCGKCQISRTHTRGPNVLVTIHHRSQDNNRALIAGTRARHEPDPMFSLTNCSAPNQIEGNKVGLTFCNFMNVLIPCDEFSRDSDTSCRLDFIARQHPNLDPSVPQQLQR